MTNILRAAVYLLVQDGWCVWTLVRLTHVSTYWVQGGWCVWTLVRLTHVSTYWCKAVGGVCELAWDWHTCLLTGARRLVVCVNSGETDARVYLLVQGGWWCVWLWTLMRLMHVSTYWCNAVGGVWTRVRLTHVSTYWCKAAGGVCELAWDWHTCLLTGARRLVVCVNSRETDARVYLLVQGGWCVWTRVRLTHMSTYWCKAAGMCELSCFLLSRSRSSCIFLT